MEIKKFEKYEIDEDGNIGEEHAKEIISKYIDDYSEGKTLQDSFDYHIGELEVELREFVVRDINLILYDLNHDIQKLDISDDHYIKKDGTKYNL